VWTVFFVGYMALIFSIVGSLSDPGSMSA
jgi:hypothetical protein